VYLFATSSQKADASNKTPRQITKIESAGGFLSSSLKISYTPALAILKADSMTFEGTQCIPSIDGAQSVESVLSDGQITISVSKMPTTLKEGGVIHVHTTTAAQANAAVGSAAKAIGQAGGELGGGLFGGLFSGLGGLLSGLGIPLAICCVLIILFALYSKFG
jgi:hypothetical protein